MVATALELGGVGAPDRPAQAMTRLLRRNGLIEVALMGIFVGREGVPSKLRIGHDLSTLWGAYPHEQTDRCYRIGKPVH